MLLGWNDVSDTKIRKHHTKKAHKQKQKNEEEKPSKTLNHNLILLDDCFCLKWKCFVSSRRQCNGNFYFHRKVCQFSRNWKSLQNVRTQFLRFAYLFINNAHFQTFLCSHRGQKKIVLGKLLFISERKQKKNTENNLIISILFEKYIKTMSNT